MILLLAIFVGLLAGLLRSWISRRELVAPNLHHIWLVPVAFLPQFLIFQDSSLGRNAPDHLAAAALVGSLLLLLIFAWINREQPGFSMLGLGLLLNLIVIAANGGLMPISPQSVTELLPHAPPGAWHLGERLGVGKDIVLSVEATRLWWLSDRFLVPDWSPYRVAYSLGDILISFGAFWLLWAMSNKKEVIQPPAKYINSSLKNDQREAV